VKKAFRPESEPIGDSASFQVQIDCGAPTNTSTVHTLDANTPVSINGFLDTGCTVTELAPPEIDKCVWKPAQYEIGGYTSTNPANVETSLSDPTVTIWNALECDFGKPKLDIQKTLISEEPCFDSVTGQFNCQFQITVTNTGTGTAEGPFTVSDTLNNALAYVPPTAASNGWNCVAPPPNYPLNDPLECTSPAGLDILPGASTSFTIDMHAGALFPPSENCAAIMDQDGQTLESCVDLQTPDLRIEKTLLTPDCAYNPTTECLFDITVTNVGPVNYQGPLFINDVAQPQSNWMTLPTVLTTVPPLPPASDWTCFPETPQTAITSGAWTGHFCYANDILLPANGGSSTFQLGMDGATFRMTDLPDNCASILFSSPLQESCVDIRWVGRKPTLEIEKTKVTLGSCQGMGPSPQLCEFKITVTNVDTINYEAPLTISDAVTGLPGVPLMSYDDPVVWNCQSGASVNCDSIGNVLIPPNGTVTLTLVLDMANPTYVDENCARLPNVDQDPIPTSCVTLEGQEPPALDIEKRFVECINTVCRYEITVTNTGGPFSGPLSVSDGFTSTGGGPIPNHIGTNSVDGWGCLPMGPAMSFDCDVTTINIGANQTSTFVMEFIMPIGPDYDPTTPDPVYENCATLDQAAPLAALTSCAATPTPQPILDVEKIKLSAHKCHEPDGTGSTSNACEFKIIVTNKGPGDFAGDIVLADEFVWTPMGLSGPSTPITWSPNPPWTCAPSTSGTDCTASNVSLAENGTLELTITLDHGSWNGAWPDENCVTITTPFYSEAPQDCVPIAPPTLEKSLAAGQTDCWDSLTGNFSCEFEFTVTHNEINQHTIPYSLTDSLPPLTGINGTVTSGNWTCSAQSNGTDLYCYQTGSPAMNFGTTDSFTVLITGNSVVAPAENCATLSEVTHVDVMAEACVGIPDTPETTAPTHSLLDISKSKPVPFDCNFSGGNCTFEIQITNLGPDPFSGPVQFNDTMNMFGFSYPVTPVVSVSPSMWSCQAATGNGNDCFANISASNPIPVGGVETVTLTLSVPNNIAVHSNNCVMLTQPAQSPPPLDCIGIEFAPMAFLQVHKVIAADTDMPVPAGTMFDIDVTCGTSIYNASVTAGGSALIEMGGSISNCQITEPVLPALPDPECFWDAPTLSQANGFSVPAGEDLSVTVTNRILCPLQGAPAPSGNTATSWDLGPVISVPVAGDIITGDQINVFPDVPEMEGVDTPLRIVTESAVIRFEDVYSPSLGLRAGFTRPFNDRWALVGGGQYQRFNGSQTSLGRVNGAALTGRMDDFTQLGIDAGLEYNWPQIDMGALENVSPYIQGRAGVSHISPIRLRGAMLGNAPINDGIIPMYRSSIVPTADVILGLDIPLANDNLSLGLETGVSLSGALRSDSGYFGPGVPLAGTNNSATRMNVPFRMKLETQF